MGMDEAQSRANGVEALPPPVERNAVFRPPSEMESEDLRQLTDSIVAALKTVYDPEIPADIYELGLIYNVDIDDSRFVSIEMTLTAPACPVAGEMPTWVENAVSAVPGVAGAKVNMVFDPPWDQTRMSDEARVALDMW
jgi:FeS assembly SUF system protein